VAEEELIVKMTLEDNLSRESAAAKKNVNALARELEKARAEAEKTGDYSDVQRLGKEFEQAQSRSISLRRELSNTRAEVRNLDKQTQTSAGKMGGAWKKLQGVFKNPLFTAATIAGVTLFGRKAVQAFAQAEQSQLKLVEAYRKFNAIQNVPIESIRALASELQTLTGTDDDLLAAAAATLARFELTGDAITRLLPLVNDFAILTGRDVVDASEAIGKAFMGNARALKELGIDFRRTGDTGKDFETIMAALEAKAGGAGKAFGETAQGGLARAKAAFSDLQEEIGGTLVPALTALLRVVEPFVKFVSGMPGPIKAVVIGIGVFSAALLALGPRIAMIITGLKSAGVSMVGFKGKMSAAAAVAGGPFGVALAAASVAIAAFMIKQAEANARVEEFSQSIDEATGKLSQAGIASVAERLLGDISDDDWKLLEQLGITVEDATLAVIGGADAWENFREQKAEAVNRAAIGKERELLSILEGNVMGLRSEVQRGTAAWYAAKRAQEIAARSSERVAYTSGTVLAALQKANPVLGEYRDKALSASGAATALKVANENAAKATERLTGGLADLQSEIGRQQAMAAYKTALDEFVKEPSEETAAAVTSAMITAASAIEEPKEQARFTKRAIDEIRDAASDAGMKLNPELDKGLGRARGQAKLLETQINRAVRARVVDITLRFRDSRSSFDTSNNAHGGYIDSRIGGPTSDTVPAMLSRGEYVLRAGAVNALRAAVGEAGLWSLNHSDRSMPSFLDSPVPSIAPGGGSEPALVGAGGPVINIGEIKADSGVDVQSEVLWAMRRAERIRRERS
jgi:hypothetical protein